jgi:hypothetical protein
VRAVQCWRLAAASLCPPHGARPPRAGQRHTHAHTPPVWQCVFICIKKLSRSSIVAAVNSASSASANTSLIGNLLRQLALLDRVTVTAPTQHAVRLEEEYWSGARHDGERLFRLSILELEVSLLDVSMSHCGGSPCLVSGDPEAHPPDMGDAGCNAGTRVRDPTGITCMLDQTE